MPVHIGNAVSKQIKEAFLGKQGSEDPVCWCIVSQVRYVLGRTFDGKTVSMRKDYSLIFFRHLIVTISNYAYMKLRVCFAENIEEYLIARSRSIEGTLNRDNPFVVVLLIVRENHQLRDVDEATESLVLHPGLNAILFCKNTLGIVGFLDLNKCERETVHKACDVGAEVVSALLVLTGELCGNVPLVVGRVGKINQLDATDGR